MAYRGRSRLSLMNRHLIALPLIVIVAALIHATAADATDIKTLGRLKIPQGAAVMTICTDPVVQNVLTEDLRSQQRSGPTMVVTVTVNARALAPGVSLQELSPGDPSVAGMLKEMGAEPPLLGDTGDKQSEDAYTAEARRQALTNEDPMTEGFRNYVAQRNEMTNNTPSQYNIPADQMYQTAIIARATVSNSATEFKVVALVAPGDDVRTAKKLVAEEIANAILH